LVFALLAPVGAFAKPAARDAASSAATIAVKASFVSRNPNAVASVAKRQRVPGPVVYRGPVIIHGVQY
jgi:hypothetical protein